MFSPPNSYTYLVSYLYLMFLVNLKFLVGIGKDVVKEHGFQTSLVVLWFLLRNVYVVLLISLVKNASPSYC